jgi:dienelactone hydrolase
MNTVGKVKEGWQWFGSRLSRLAQAVAPGPRAWRGATWGLLVMVLLVWGANAIAAFGPAGPLRFSASLLVTLAVAGLFGTLLLALGWLLRRAPGGYRWALFSSLPLLLFSFLLAPSLALGMATAVVGLILFSSLLGAGITAVTGGNWSQLTRPHKGLAVSGITLGTVGLLVGGGLLLVDGFDTTPPVNAAWQTDTAVTPLDLPNPAAPGPYPVLTLTYGSGSDRHRPEYGARVTLTTTGVDGSQLITKNWTGLRTSYWGIEPDNLPRNGRVWYPDGDGPFPIVFILHGNHPMEDYSDAGYAYLGQLLASRGYIAVSVDQNFLNLSVVANLLVISPLERENDARAWLLLEHIRQWQEWHATPGNPFHGQVDFDAIALIGHSRGGEAVAIAAAFSRLAYHPDNAVVTFDYDFDIQSIVAIAPVDGQYRPGERPLPLADVNYLLLHGSHDMDVVSFMGARLYNRLQLSGDPARFKAALHVYGANHGQFNRDWGRQDIFGVSNTLYNLRAIMPPAEQEQIAQVTISAFLEATLRGESGYRALFQDPRTGADWLPDTIYLSQYQDSDTVRLVTYEEDIDLRTTTLPGGHLHGENLTIWREQVVPQRWGDLGSTAVYLGWDRTVNEETARYTLTLPDDLTLSDETALTFSLAAIAENPNPDSDDDNWTDLDAIPPIGLTLRLVDGQGEEARLPLSHIAMLQPPLPVRLGKANFMGVLPETEVIFQTFAFVLGDFTAVNPTFDPQTVTQVQFVFDQTPAGVVALDEIGLRQTGE